MSYFLLIIPALKGENPRPPWDMKVHNPAVLVGRNTHDDGRTSESLTVPAVISLAAIRGETQG